MSRYIELAEAKEHIKESLENIVKNIPEKKRKEMLEKGSNIKKRMKKYEGYA